MMYVLGVFALPEVFTFFLIYDPARVGPRRLNRLLQNQSHTQVDSITIDKLFYQLSAKFHVFRT
jgi:hypothetical protein